MLILGGNPIGNCLGRRWLAFLGRPSGRTVCSDPRSFTVSRTHVSSPYGRPRSMLTRTRVRLNHDALERLEVGLLAEHMHPADGSVQDVIDKAPGATLAVVGMSTSATRTEDFRQYQSRPGFRPPARGEKARMRVVPRCLSFNPGPSSAHLAPCTTCLQVCRPAHCSGTRLSRILCAAYLSKRPTPGAFHSRPLTMPSKGSLDRPSRRSERVVIANALSGGQGMNSLIVARSDPAHDSSWTASLRAATGIATVTESALFTSQ
jgi:hypothetical protein